LAETETDPPLFRKAVEAHRKGNLPEASRLYVAVLKIAPEHFGALDGLGLARAQQGKREDAVGYLSRAAQLRPGAVVTLANLGNALLELGRFEEAAARLRVAAGLDPQKSDVHYQLGNALAALDRFEEAIASYDRALAVRPKYADALCNRGSALVDLHRFDEAMVAFARLLAIDPQFPEAHYNLGLVHLFRGEFVLGWSEYEWRWKARSFDSKWRAHRAPRWQGGRVDGTLLAWGEQGLGDQILHAGMVEDLARHARRVALEVDSRLVPLFQRSFPQCRVSPQAQLLQPPPADAVIALGSVGMHCRRDWSEFPVRAGGYLKADAARAGRLRAALARPGERLVGLSWRSTNRRLGHVKSMRLADLSDLLAVPGCRFVDLQYGDTREELEAVQRGTGARIERVAEIDNRRDLDGLAALVSACDLVVTVSNTTAHLAGALGVPAWVLLPRGLGQLWYWFDDREDSPWYPSLRLLRQPAGGDWASAARRAAALLRERARSA